MVIACNVYHFGIWYHQLKIELVTMEAIDKKINVGNKGGWWVVIVVSTQQYGKA